MVGRWAEPVVYSNFCKRIQLTDSEYVPQFIGWLIRGCYLNGVVQKWRTGTSVPNLDIAALLSGIVVPGLPRLAQVSVAGFLDRISGKIELNRKMNQTLEEMAQAIFKSWFIDFDGHDPADLVESELGPIPRGWGVTTVKEAVSELETGSRPKGGVAKYTSGVPSIGAESITGLGEYDYSKTKFIPPDFFAAMRRGVLRSRDLLIYKDGGKPGDYRPHVSMFGDGFPFVDASINSHVYRLRAADGLTQEYLYFWFSSAPVMEEMKRRGTGAAIPSLPRTNLYSMPILIPAESRLHDFQDVAEPLVGRVLSNSLQSRTLAELRDTLLPKLISGEIRVPEPEEQVEAAL
jgi:type I restriction enzyme S subunit